jgi:hypothetical protein
LDLERGGMRGRSERERVQREKRFVVFGKNNLLGFLGMLSIFQPILGTSHEDLGTDFILDAIDKKFLEKSIIHSLYFEI